MSEYTEITKDQYFDELDSRMKTLNGFPNIGLSIQHLDGELDSRMKSLEEGANDQSTRTGLQKLITSTGIETAKMLEDMDEPELKPVYLKVNGFDPLFGYNSVEVMPKIRYDQVKSGREFYRRA